jgi:F1F0 ATPase subunit 2
MDMDASPMSRFTIIEHDSLGAVFTISAALAVGVLTGAVHSLMLWRSVQIFVQGGSVFHAVLSHLLRFFMAAAGLLLICHNGPLPLCAALLAFLAVRTFAVRRMGLTA